MFDVITIGGATRDIFFDIDSLEVQKAHNYLSEPHLEIPYGEKIIADKTSYSYGGGAINVSVALSRLGLKTAALTNVGLEGTGGMIVDFLKKEKVNTKFVHRDKLLHTGLSVFLVGPGGEHTAFLERGANNHLQLENLTDLRKTKWFYISSLTGDSERILPTIFEFAQRHQIKIAFNPGSRQLAEGWPGLKKYLAACEVLILNLEEAEKLVHSKLGHLPVTEKELMTEVKKLGAVIAVVTEGEVGSHVVFDGHLIHQGSMPKQVVDTTGAGDAFGATFLYGIYKEFDLKYCLKIAAINSAAVVAEMGSSTGLLTYGKIKKSSWL